MNVPMQVNISSSLIDRWAMDVLPGRFSTSLAPAAPKGNPTRNRGPSKTPEGVGPLGSVTANNRRPAHRP